MRNCIMCTKIQTRKMRTEVHNLKGDPLEIQHPKFENNKLFQLLNDFSI